MTKRLAADRPSLSLVAVLAAPSVGAAGLRIDRVFARFHRPATPARVV